MNPVGWVHHPFVHKRRVRVLANRVASLLPVAGSVLDVGSGDGLIGAEIMRLRPALAISGIDVLPRANTHMPVQWFDGHRIPCADQSVDAVTFIDVLHHTEDPMELLSEARRVTRRAILIKDHCRDGFFAAPTLRLMDWVGNARHGVALPYNYLTASQWSDAFRAQGLRTTLWVNELNLYPRPFTWIFDRSLHFLAVLTA